MRSYPALATAAASVTAALCAQSALAQYTTVSNFQTPVDGVIDNAANWTNGYPTSSTTLAVFDYTAVDGLSNPLMTMPVAVATGTTPMQAYGLQILNLNAVSNVTTGYLTPAPLILTSTDTAVDSGSQLSPAFVRSGGTTVELDIDSAIQLGVANGSNGTATFLHSNAGTTLFQDKISQAANTVWGLTIAGTGEIRARASNNGSNYVANRWELDGQLSVAAGARLRALNNVLPYGFTAAGAARPNYQVDGELRHALNGGVLMYNAVDGSTTGILGRQSGNEIGIGANNGNGNFQGAVNSTSTRIYKVGSGTQTFTNAANAYGQLTVLEGTVSVDTVSSSGNSGLGSGGTRLDGGTIKYTGAGSPTSRQLTVGMRGGVLDASGTGALTIGGTGHLVNLDESYAIGDAIQSGTSLVVPNMYGLTGLNAMQSNLKIVSANAGINNAANLVGGTQFTIDETARTLTFDVSTTANVGVPSSSNGAPRITFTSVTAQDRTLTLTGTNSGANTLAASVVKSPLGADVNIAKSGAGTWQLTGTNYSDGSITVNAGNLVVDGATVAAVLGRGVTTQSGGSAGTVLTGDTSGLVVGQPISGTNIPAGSVITGITANTSFTISANATAAGATTVDAAAGGAFGGGGAIVNGGTLVVAQKVTPLTPRQLSSLSITGGKVDLTNNKLTITTASDATIRSQIAAGRNGGAWDGATGITSSTAALDPLTYGVGHAATGGGSKVSYSLLGDLDLDGDVDFDDAFELTNNYGTPSGSVWVNGDTDYDGDIDFDDAFSQVNNYGGALATTSGGNSDGVASLVYDASTGTLKIEHDFASGLKSFNISIGSGAPFSFNASEEARWETENKSFSVDLATQQGFSTNTALGATFLAANGYVIDDALGGTLLASGLSQASLLQYLTITYGIEGQTGTKTGDLIVIPEPTTLGLLGLAAMGLGRRRRTA